MLGSSGRIADAVDAGKMPVDLLRRQVGAKFAARDILRTGIQALHAMQYLDVGLHAADYTVEQFADTEVKIGAHLLHIGIVHIAPGASASAPRHSASTSAANRRGPTQFETGLANRYQRAAADDGMNLSGSLSSSRPGMRSCGRERLLTVVDRMRARYSGRPCNDVFCMKKITHFNMCAIMYSLKIRCRE